MVKRFLFHIPWVIWLSIIAILSLIPGDQLPVFKIDWISIDTVIHFLMYFGLSILFLVGFHFKNKKMNLSKYRLYGWVILIGILIGYILELLQGNLIYRRYYDIIDVVANGFGTTFGVITYYWLNHFYWKKKENSTP